MSSLKIILLLLLVSGTSATSILANPPEKLWFYTSVNFQVEKQITDLITLMERAKKSGYTGVFLNDFKFGKMSQRPQHFYANIQRVMDAAKRLELDVIPGVMPIGYSNSLLINNPNLAEGIAVKECLYFVKEGQAMIAEETNYIQGGDFEEAEQKKPAGWNWVDHFGTCVTLDHETKQSGKSSVKLSNFKQDKAGNSRLQQALVLKPWQEYEITFWAKSADLNVGEAKVTLLTEKGKQLCYTNAGIKKNQDWTQHRIIFNTLENSKVNFYIGVWGGISGTLWIDSITLKNVGGINMVRRDGCPIKVTSLDGKTIYQEGVDFEPWAYEKMGSDPWPGNFQISHPQPPIKLKKNSSIQEGQKLLVSFYHTIVIHDFQVCSCLLEEQAYAFLKQQIEAMELYFKPKYYFMSHDELRLVAQCELCLKSGKTAGELLAYNVSRCEKIIHEVNPQATILVWSDMFDPFHNAVDNYYLASSTLKSSWEGLSKSTVIANWNHNHSAQSTDFFTQRGHTQLIAGYYDSPKIKENLSRWVETDSKKVNIGYMYTTWKNDYSKLETFAEIIKELYP